MLVVGAFAGAQQVAMYSVSEKLYQASQSITSPVAQAIFPYLAKSKDQSVLSRTIIFVGAPLALGCLLVGYWAEDLLTLLFGAEFAEAKLVLQLFLTVTIVNFICVMFGYPAFGTLDKIHLANYTVYVGAAVQLIILYFLYLTNGISAISVVASVLITETVVMLLRMTLYIRHKA